MDLRHWLGRATDAMEQWAGTFGPSRPHPSLLVDNDRFAAAFEEFSGTRPRPGEQLAGHHCSG